MSIDPRFEDEFAALASKRLNECAEGMRHPTEVAAPAMDLSTIHH